MKNWKIGDLVETRNAYGKGLLELGRQRQDVIVLDADLQRSNKTFDYGQEHPELFYDMGISEADMVSTAAGMSALGFTVFATTFAMFLPGRCYDQIRLQVAYGRSNVKLAGVSAGITEGPDGGTHQSLDDISMMRNLPEMIVVVPADAEEAYQAVLWAAEHKGPVYLRFGRYPTPVIFDDQYRFEIGKAKVVREGKDIALFATGIMVAKAIQAAEALEQDGIKAEVINVSTIKPFDCKKVLEAAKSKQLLVSLEESSILGGLGSAIAETLSEVGSTPPLLRIGVNDCFGQSGKADELLEYYGLTAPAIVEAVKRRLKIEG